MAETKTRPTDASVDAYLASRASPDQLADCKAIMAMCKRVTKQQPRMWGLAENPGQVELVVKLGKHKMGKSCLYFKRLADLDVKVLEALIAGSVADAKRRYPHPRDA